MSLYRPVGMSRIYSGSIQKFNNELLYGLLVLPGWIIISLRVMLTQCDSSYADWVITWLPQIVNLRSLFNLEKFIIIRKIQTLYDTLQFTKTIRCYHCSLISCNLRWLVPITRSGLRKSPESLSLGSGDVLASTLWSEDCKISCVKCDSK